MNVRNRNVKCVNVNAVRESVRKRGNGSGKESVNVKKNANVRRNASVCNVNANVSVKCVSGNERKLKYRYPHRKRKWNKESVL